MSDALLGAIAARLEWRAHRAEAEGAALTERAELANALARELRMLARHVAAGRHADAALAHVGDDWQREPPVGELRALRGLLGGGERP
jgi:hypothetical protein